MALYIPTLFTRGYGFSNDTQQIHVEPEINGQPPGRGHGALHNSNYIGSQQPILGTRGEAGSGGMSKSSVGPLVRCLCYIVGISRVHRGNNVVLH